MIRQVIQIEKDKCNGCGICTNACHEGALAIIDGKATLIKDDYCDGMGDCLPGCPQNAISFITREANPYDEAQVKRHLQEKNKKEESNLNNWPCQIKLAPMSAPYFSNSHLLIAADCSAYAYASIHKDFMKDKVTLIGCSKLDNIDYSEKLTNIFLFNSIKSITVLRMEVPCCGGLEMMVKKAIIQSGKNIPLEVITISSEGKIL